MLQTLHWSWQIRWHSCSWTMLQPLPCPYPLSVCLLSLQRCGCYHLKNQNIEIKTLQWRIQRGYFLGIGHPPPLSENLVKIRLKWHLKVEHPPFKTKISSGPPFKKSLGPSLSCIFLYQLHVYTFRHPPPSRFTSNFPNHNIVTMYIYTT